MFSFNIKLNHLILVETYVVGEYISGDISIDVHTGRGMGKLLRPTLNFGMNYYENKTSRQKR